MDELVQMLTDITQNTHHYAAPPNTQPPYIVWQEFDQDEIMDADGEQDVYSVSGTIDIFSLAEKEPLVKQVRESLNGSEVGFYLKSVQYEEDTGLIHWEFEFSLVGWLDAWPV